MTLVEILDSRDVKVKTTENGRAATIEYGGVDYINNITARQMIGATQSMITNWMNSGNAKFRGKGAKEISFDYVRYPNQHLYIIYATIRALREEKERLYWQQQ